MWEEAIKDAVGPMGIELPYGEFLRSTHLSEVEGIENWIEKS